VSSPRFVELIRAPLCTSISTIFRWPSLAAQCNGLNPWSSLETKKKSKGENVWRRKHSAHFTAATCIRHLTHPWFMSCSVSSSQTRTCMAMPSRHHWNISSIAYVNETTGNTRTGIAPRNWPRSVRMARRMLEILRTGSVMLYCLFTADTTTRTNTPNLAIRK